MNGLFWELNPGPLAPEARIIPLDQTADANDSDYNSLAADIQVAMPMDSSKHSMS